MQLFYLPSKRRGLLSKERMYIQIYVSIFETVIVKAADSMPSMIKM